MLLVAVIEELQDIAEVRERVLLVDQFLELLIECGKFCVFEDDRFLDDPISVRRFPGYLADL